MVSALSAQLLSSYSQSGKSDMHTHACLQHFLTKDGRWGRQDRARWDAFLDWLSDRKLLTTKVQSRTLVQGLTASLDDLRQGDAGEVIPRDILVSDALFTNNFLL